MKVLIIGSGGREHALGWKLAQSRSISKLYFCPDNPGSAEIGENIGFGWEETDRLVEFATNNRIDLAIVSMDDALAAGITDKLQAVGVNTFGPSKFAAQIESSKSFAKDMMRRLNIPTAKYQNFSDYHQARKYLTQQTLPIVIKASGLARGKGVVICKTLRQANNTLREIMVDKCFGQAGSSVVIEEFLEGYELSVHALSDGKTAVMFPISQDNKAIFDGDKGPNTGGMGVVAPVDILSSSDINYIKTRIVQPIIDEFNRLGHPYVGCLYPGLMITKQGIKVIEYNARFGDPEAQCYMRLLQSDLVEHIVAATKGKLNQEKIVWSDSSAVCIVLASKGYPQISSINTEITGLNNLKNKKVVVFQAGTKKKGKNLFTNGGRVLSITSIGNNSTQARKLAYEAAGQIKFDGMQYRNDIGLLKPTMNSVKNH